MLTLVAAVEVYDLACDTEGREMVERSSLPLASRNAMS